MCSRFKDLNKKRFKSKHVQHDYRNNKNIIYVKKTMFGILLHVNVKMGNI